MNIDVKSREGRLVSHMVRVPSAQREHWLAFEAGKMKQDLITENLNVIPRRAP